MSLDTTATTITESTATEPTVSEPGAGLPLSEQEVLARFAEKVEPCEQTLGQVAITAADAQRGEITMEFDSTEAQCHSGNVVQGGFVAGMLDSAMSMAVIAQSEFTQAPASLEIKVSYLKSTHPGRNRAVGRVVQSGRSVVFVEGELYNAGGELLAKASSVAKLVPYHSAHHSAHHSA